MNNLPVQEQYPSMEKLLNEKQWRQYLALEAKKLGNITQVSIQAGVSRNTIKKGLRELKVEGLYQPGDPIRKKGAGIKSLKDTDKTLVSDLEAIIEPKGDPQTHLRWTTKSLNNLVEQLSGMGHRIKKSALANLLHAIGFSLKANKKNIEGVSHPDRGLQFTHINATCKAFEQRGLPIISVDCKKKELIGNFKNNGREWLPKGKNTSVNVYDYTSLADGKAVPYGVYDVTHNNGFINVGIDMIPASLLLRVSADGGSTLAKNCILKHGRFLLLPTEVVLMDQETDYGDMQYKSLPMKQVSQLLFVIFRLQQVNGTRLNTGFFPLFQLIGEHNH